MCPGTTTWGTVVSLLQGSALTNAPQQLNAPSASSHCSSLCHLLLVLSCPDRTLSGEMWQKQSPHSSGCLPAVLAHTTAPLPHCWAQGTTGGFGWVRPPRQGLVPPSVLGCWGCSLLCSLVSPLRPLLCCSVTVLFSVSPLKIKGVWEYSLFFHEKGLCFFFLPFPSCSIA